MGKQQWQDYRDHLLPGLMDWDKRLWKGGYQGQVQNSEGGYSTSVLITPRTDGVKTQETQNEQKIHIRIR